MHSALKEKTRAKGPNTPLKAALLTSMGSTSKSEAASKLKAKSGDPHTSKPPTGASTPVAAVTPKTSPHELDADDLDLAAMNLLPRVGDAEDVPSRHLPVKDRRKLLEEVSRTLNDASDGRKMLSLVVIGKSSVSVISCFTSQAAGHVDAGKSTLLGRLLYELGSIDDRT